MSSIEITPIHIQTPSTITVTHSLFHHESPPSNKLMAIFPGLGYTSEHPLLYYLRQVALMQGYDVLSVQYSFQAAPHWVKYDGVGWDGVAHEANEALAQITERAYQEICFVGKSLGTPLAVRNAQKHLAPKSRLILLTPLRAATVTIFNIPTLAVIGTDDSYYDPDQIARDRNKGIIWEVLEGLDHSLEVTDHWIESINVLPGILKKCEQFLNSD